jgi:cephalosporin hydroxylase
MLKQIIDEYGLEPGTDKGTVHSYIEVYDEIFKERRFKVETMVEVGVFTGCSLYMWAKYFPNAKVYGIDFDLTPFLTDAGERRLMPEYREELTNNHTILRADGYSEAVVRNLPQLDVAIDDGSHQLTHQQRFVQLYKPLLKPQGILVVEDISGMRDAQEILKCFSEEEQPRCNIFDLTDKKGRTDDILLVYQND